MSTELNKKWIKLESFDYLSFEDIDIVPFNSDEFGVFEFGIWESKFESFLRYHSLIDSFAKDDEIVKIIKETMSPHGLSKLPNYTYDALTKNLYFQVDTLKYAVLYCMNLETRKLEQMGKKMHFDEYIDHIFKIKNEIHGIDDAGEHRILYGANESISKTEKDFRSPAIYVASQQIIVRLGTSDDHNDAMCSNLLIFSLGTQSWRKIKNLKFRAQSFGSALCSNEKYIVLMGGYIEVGNIDVGDIYVLDIRNDDVSKWILNKSSIKCPKTGKCKAVRTGGVGSKDEILVTGFIKECFCQNEFYNLQLPPSYIIDSITDWYNAEMIHWIHQNGDHCGIYLNDILLSC